MARKLICFLITFSLAFSTLWIPAPARACGPFFPLAVFVQTKHPDLPLKNFAAGELGILQPSYARSYLVVAYRYLTGSSFSPSEQNQLLALWMNRLDRYDEPERSDKEDAEGTWLRMRRQITGLNDPSYLDRHSKQFPTYRDSRSAHFYYWNCLDDSFSTAATTLRARAKQFGPHSAVVRDWVKAQDAVFQNCGGDDSYEEYFAPQLASEELPPIIKLDREYQIAAAQFYAHRWADAERSFLQISQETNSPWRNLASLVAIRCKIRMTTDATKEEEWNEIAGRLKTLDRDPSLREIRPAIQRTLSFVRARSSPERRVADLGRFLQANIHPENLYHDLDDYTILLDRIVGDYPASDTDYRSPERIPRLFEKSRTLRVKNDLTDWIFTYQASGKTTSSHAIAQWHKTHSLPWLICALAKSEPSAPQLPALLAEADQVSLKSTASLTLSYLHARILVGSGRADEAREIADANLARLSTKASPSAVNTFRTLRMNLATNLTDFVSHAARTPVLVTLDDEFRDIPYKYLYCGTERDPADAACEFRKKPAPAMFDEQTSVILTEKLPTGVLAQLSADSALPTRLRELVARSAFTRAALLDDAQSGPLIAHHLLELDPSLKRELQTYLSADSAESRRFAAFFLILRQPGMHPYVDAGVGREMAPDRIDIFQNNWWCSWQPRSTDDYRLNYYNVWTGSAYEFRPSRVCSNLTSPAILDAASRSEAEAEFLRLKSLGPADQVLGDAVISWANMHPEDSRIPEALHNINRVYRYGCGETTQLNYSKIAFELLHKKYPDSEWTRKTPYWF